LAEIADEWLALSLIAPIEVESSSAALATVSIFAKACCAAALTVAAIADGSPA
jgi:hypothetical protein